MVETVQRTVVSTCSHQLLTELCRGTLGTAGSGQVNPCLCLCLTFLIPYPAGNKALMKSFVLICNQLLPFKSPVVK